MDILGLYRGLIPIADKFEDIVDYTEDGVDYYYPNTAIVDRLVINIILVMEEARFSFRPHCPIPRDLSKTYDNLKWELIEFIINNIPELTIRCYESEVYILLKEYEKDWLEIVNKKERSLDECIVTDIHYTSTPHKNTFSTCILVEDRNNRFMCISYVYMCSKYTRSDENVMEYYRSKFQKALDPYELKVVIE